MPEQGKLVTINMFYCEAAVEGVFTIELDNQLSIWMSKHDCWQLVLQTVASELHPKVRNHGEGPY